MVEDRSVTATPPTRHVKPIGPSYFETMGNPMVAGRAITWADVHQTATVAVVSENLAREYWGEPSKAAREAEISTGVGFHAGPAFFVVGFPLNTDNLSAVFTMGLKIPGVGIRW